MLDELLGRAELKARIEELEEEKRHLERRAEAEEERRSEAVRERQSAEERVNRLEDRIEELQDRVERLSGDGSTEVSFRGREDLRGDRLESVLDRLNSFETGPEAALTAVVDEDVPAPVADAFGERSALVRRAAPCVAVTDDAGVVSAALSPPRLPESFVEWGDRFPLDRSWFRPTEPVRVALVRSDLFALGVYDGESVTLVDELESDVKSKHSKGGFSQGRFERRRDEQVKEHVERAYDAIDAHGGDGDGDLVVLGERTVLGQFESLADATGRVDASGDPEEALEAAVREFWTTRLYRL